MYHEAIQRILAGANIEVGDRIEVDGRIGILMPSHAFSAEDVLILKLSNGYNIGVRIDEHSKLGLRDKKRVAERIERDIPSAADKKNISIISTGGTIASYVDYRTGAVHPALDAKALAFTVPELVERYNVHAEILYSILSEDFRGEHWRALARAVANMLNEGADAVIIPHGTDTMGYTSAALSFMLSRLSAPVVLVGSQRSSDRPSSDAALNLLAASELANADLGEVVVVMHGESSDDHALIHRGTRVRKLHTSRRDAFKSVNAAPLGRIEGNKIEFFERHRAREPRKKGKRTVKVNAKLEENVALIYFHPGMTPERFKRLAEGNKGIVVMGTGLGHIASALVDTVKALMDAGTFVVMTSQCLYGRINMKVYSTGRDLLKAGVISGEDMLPETAYVKLMHVLGQTGDEAQVRELMRTDLAGELGGRTPYME